MTADKNHRNGSRTTFALRCGQSPKVEPPLRDREIESHRAIERASSADATRQVLQALNLPEGAIRNRELEELNGVLIADYRIVPALPAPKTARYLAGLLHTTADPRNSVWKSWHNSTDFRVRLHDFDSTEIAVHAAPYTRGAGLLLWGFSCNMRVGDTDSFIIFLNTAHRAGAVNATMAHELGHYIYSLAASDRCQAVSNLSANFASHLEDDAELFSDSLVALSAYGIESIIKVRPRLDALPSAENWTDEIKQAQESIHPEYRMDFAGRVMNARWRLRYLTATIHFFKLRKALFETAGI